MRRLIWITSLWPGLAPLWLRGQWSGLVVAVAFAASVNFALISTFVWPQWLSRELPPLATPVVAWVLVLGFWIVGLRAGVRELSRPQPSAEPDPRLDAWFREAQTEYLKGHWIEAETLLSRLLARQPADAEARLLLSSVWRRTKRIEPAKQGLLELKQTPARTKWWLEIETELAQLTELEQPEPTTIEPPTATHSRAA
ncbi:MAG: hypothetical protein SFU86_10255 [Pirellulaceae bacterium]|nr:hypothetical protein [Pirellulaceae bacterium]